MTKHETSFLQERIAALEAENRHLRSLVASDPESALERVVATLGLEALSSPEPDVFYAEVCRTAASSLGATAVVFWEVQPGNLSITPRAAYGVSQVHLGRRTAPTTGSGHLARALAESNPVSLALADDGTARWLFAEGLQQGTTIGVGPASGRVGALAVYDRKPQDFPDHHMTFLAHVAEVLARSAAHSEEALHLRLRNRVSRVLAEAGSLDDAAPALLAVVGEMLYLCLAEVWVPNPERHSLERAATYLDPTDEPGDGAERVLEEAADLYRELTLQAWESRSVQWLGGGSTAPDPSERVGLRPLRGIAVPILAGSECLGVLSFFTRSPLFPKFCTRRALHEAGLSAGEFLRWARAEEALRESEESLRLALRMAPFPLVISREAAKPLLVNDRFFEVTGLSEEDVDEAPSWCSAVRLRPADWNVDDVWDSGIRAGGLLPDGEYIARTATNGERRWEIRSAHLGRGASGARLSISLVNDVTEARDLQEQRRQHDQMKDEFLAVLGHELRNPLAAIQTAVGLIGRANQGREARRVGEVLDRQARKMVKLVDGLFDVSRIAKGKIQVELKPLDMGELVAGCVDLLVPRASRRGQTLTLSLPDDAVWIAGDRERLEQVTDNLLTNAIKFTPTGGTISAEVTKDGEYARFTVTDSGIGFDESVHAYLFQPFRQAPQAPDREAGGLGLGLSLVQGLVELHSGRVRAHSEGESRGARFDVWLPLTDARPTQTTESTEAPAVSPTRAVLLIEDNEDFATLLRDVLELAGHNVHITSSGPAAIGYVESNVPDLVLCDIGLPGEMSGYDVASRLRQDTRFDGTLVVALTGYGRPEDVAKAQQAGFDAHLTKPVDMETLERLLLRKRPRRRRS